MCISAECNFPLWRSKEWDRLTEILFSGVRFPKQTFLECSAWSRDRFVTCASAAGSWWTGCACSGAFTSSSCADCVIQMGKMITYIHAIVWRLGCKQIGTSGSSESVNYTGCERFSGRRGCVYSWKCTRRNPNFKEYSRWGISVWDGRKARIWQAGNTSDSHSTTTMKLTKTMILITWIRRYLSKYVPTQKQTLLPETKGNFNAKVKYACLQSLVLPCYPTTVQEVMHSCMPYGKKTLALVRFVCV